MAQRRLSRLARLGVLTGKVARSALRDRRRGDPSRSRGVGVSMTEEQAAEIAQTLGQLKGAAMKAGQQLAMAARSIGMPSEVGQALDKLHDQAEPIPFTHIQETIEADLEAPLSSLFKWFSEQPIGTASLAQAHAAALPDGTEVVVKVLHPGVQEGLDSDLLALKGILVGGRLMRRSQAELLEIFEEISFHLRQELDYYQEAANIEGFRRILGNDERYRIPRTHPAYCTQRVLTLDRLPGEHIDQFLETATPATRRVAGLALADLLLECTFRHRMLHADPHPGNFLFEPDGRIGILDFGCVKRFDEFFLGTYAHSALAALEGDRALTLQLCRRMELLQGHNPEAEDALWAFSEAVVGPWRDRIAIIGEGDKMIETIHPAARKLLTFREIRGAQELVMLHRTMGGLYAIVHRLHVAARWDLRMRPYLEHAMAFAEGRLDQSPLVDPSPPG